MTGVVMFELGPGTGPVAPLDLVRFFEQAVGRAVPGLPDVDEGGYGASIDNVDLSRGRSLNDAAYEIGSDYVREVITGLDPGRDWLPPWSWMRANDIENELFAKLIVTGDETAYRVARQFVVEHPAGEARALAQECNDRRAARVARYVPIPDGQAYRCGQRRWWWPCRVCRWPMDVRGRLVRCRYVCHTATYQVVDRSGKGPALLAVDQRLPAGVLRGLPERHDAGGSLQAEEPVWQFIVVPGHIEVRLWRVLAKAGAVVQLYPGCDNYDLEIIVGDRRWDVDVKEHATVEGLLRHIREKPRRPGTSCYLKATRGRCTLCGRRWRPTGSSQSGNWWGRSRARSRAGSGAHHDGAAPARGPGPEHAAAAACGDRAGRGALPPV